MQIMAIETDNLGKRFGWRLAVSGVSLGAPASEVYGFLGPNGAGKTTTIRMLLGLTRPDVGEVRLFGESLANNRQALMSRVGALVETPSLYPHLTGRENLEVTQRLLGAERSLIDRALGIVKLTREAGRVVREYSLGMRQRLGLALALLNRPELLILDEPTNGLDPAGIHEMRDLIRRLPVEFGITVFLSSHLLGEIEQIAEHIGIIHGGRLLFQGTLAELRARQDKQLIIGVTQPNEAVHHLAAANWHGRIRNDGMVAVAGATQADGSEINSFLINQGIGVFHLAFSQITLEDIFLALTKNCETERNAS